jgi:shikimate dehydrogenase
MSHTPELYKLGLIGFPLGHSLSPQIHSAALNALSLEGQYDLHPVPPLPEGLETLVELLDKIRQGEIHGLNVTIPHKQNVFPLLDQLTPAAQAIGAVNTIFRDGDKLVGDNTDAPGFSGDLQRLLDATDHDSLQRPLSALVLGSGGAARAVVYALRAEGYQITISARHEDQDQSRELKEQLCQDQHQMKVVETGRWAHDIDSHSLVVNCTPVGMHPHSDHTPWPQDMPLPPQAAVYDLVYNPHQTQLVKQAQQAGLPAMTGLGMLVEQAALAFERWTGFEAPRESMRSAVNL